MKCILYFCFSRGHSHHCKSLRAKSWSTISAPWPTAMVPRRFFKLLKINILSYLILSCTADHLSTRCCCSMNNWFSFVSEERFRRILKVNFKIFTIHSGFNTILSKSSMVGKNFEICWPQIARNCQPWLEKNLKYAGLKWLYYYYCHKK